MLNIHGVINNHLYGVQEIDLSRSFDMNEQENFDLEDAQVILSGGGLCDTMFCSSYYPQGGTFMAYPFELLPRTAYQIMIYAEGYDTLFGKTTTLGDFNIMLPGASDTIGINDTIVFSASEGAREYQIVVERNLGGSFYWVIWPSAEPESMFKLPLTIFSDFLSEGEYFLRVNACDSNYYDYEYYYGDDPPQCGVEGGIGLFGSMWVKQVDVYLKVN
jgi:hypothetical protein